MLILKSRMNNVRTDTVSQWFKRHDTFHIQNCALKFLHRGVFKTTQKESAMRSSPSSLLPINMTSPQRFPSAACKTPLHLPAVAGEREMRADRYVPPTNLDPSTLHLSSQHLISSPMAVSHAAMT